MKRCALLAVLLAMILCAFAGCRSGRENQTTTTTATTTQTATKPDMDEMLPGKEDTIDPENGANKPDETQDTTATQDPRDIPSRARPRPRHIP